jgi:hypothetical protein
MCKVMDEEDVVVLAKASLRRAMRNIENGSLEWAQFVCTSFAPCINVKKTSSQQQQPTPAPVPSAETPKEKAARTKKDRDEAAEQWFSATLKHACASSSSGAGSSSGTGKSGSASSSGGTSAKAAMEQEGGVLPLSPNCSEEASGGGRDICLVCTMHNLVGILTQLHRSKSMYSPIICSHNALRLISIALSCTNKLFFCTMHRSGVNPRIKRQCWFQGHTCQYIWYALSVDHFL